MPTKPQDVTDAELSILHVLWKNGTATIREITDRLYPAGSASDYATVKKLLSRLESKNCVKRDRSSNVHVFAAAIKKDELIGRRLSAVATSLCDGSLTPLLEHLVEAHDLTSQDRKSLQSLIDKLDKQSGKDKRQG